MTTEHKSTSFVITTGESTNRLGSTRLDVGALDYQNNLRLRDLNHMVDGVTMDRQMTRLPSSTAGDRAGGLLGYWYERQIVTRSQSLFFLKYSIKEITDPFQKAIILPVVLDDAYPLYELTFPVVTDAFSTKHAITMSGRFKLADQSIVGSIIGRIMDGGGSVPDIVVKSMDTYATFGVGVLEGHWKATAREARDGYADFLQIDLNRQSYTVKLRMVAPGNGSVKKRSLPRKEAETATGKKVTFIRKGRRVNLKG